MLRPCPSSALVDGPEPHRQDRPCLLQLPLRVGHTLVSCLLDGTFWKSWGQLSCRISPSLHVSEGFLTVRWKVPGFPLLQLICPALNWDLFHTKFVFSMSLVPVQAPCRGHMRPTAYGLGGFLTLTGCKGEQRGGGDLTWPCCRQGLLFALWGPSVLALSCEVQGLAQGHKLDMGQLGKGQGPWTLVAQTDHSLQQCPPPSLRRKPRPKEVQGLWGSSGSVEGGGSQFWCLH